MNLKVLLSCCCLFVSSIHVWAQRPLYQDSLASVEERVSDLLGRMTLKEKVGQLCCPLGWKMYTKSEKGEVTFSEEFKKQMSEMPVGSFWAVLRADPWTQKTLENGLTPELAAKTLNILQKYVIEHTRLGIPILFAEECPHGHMAIGATVFPTSLSQASTWNEPLIYNMAEAIASEVRSQGANIGYGPVLDVARDPRWSRMEETFGEDPYLTGCLGTAFVRGMQGENFKDGCHVFSTLKHLAAYGVPRGGHNGNPAEMGLRTLLNEYLPPFCKAVKQGGAASVMTSYNAIDGIPCTANPYLVDSLLRKKWGFDGFVFSDLASIDGLVGNRVASDLEDAAVQAIMAGTDVDLGAQAYRTLIQAVKQGKLDVKYLDRAVAHVLKLKFKMGLFENPYVSPERARKIVNCESHRQLARQVAREGTVLLRNKGILPLSKNVRRIAVIGPNADMMYNYLGDYTAPQRRDKIVTLLDAIRKKVPHAVVDYAKGCAIRDTTRTDIASAVEIARKADVVILAVGGSSARDFQTKYINTGAAMVSEDQEILSDMECGEGFDRSTLNLMGDQERLIKAVAQTGKPLVVVYIAGRPLNMNLASQVSDALLTAWYPGEQGGNGIADILFGDYNPSGRLPVSIPRNEGQLPIYYSQGAQRDYVDCPASPLFAFGYGLSYTHFVYSNIRMEPGNGSDILQKVTCTITNTGDYDGEEVVQLYVNHEVASIVLPAQELKGFKKIYLRKGESKDVSFSLTRNDLSFYNRKMDWGLEPGRIHVMIGGASDNISLKGSFDIPGQ